MTDRQTKKTEQASSLTAAPTTAERRKQQSGDRAARLENRRHRNQIPDCLGSPPDALPGAAGIGTSSAAPTTPHKEKQKGGSSSGAKSGRNADSPAAAGHGIFGSGSPWSASRPSRSPEDLAAMLQTPQAHNVSLGKIPSWDASGSSSGLGSSEMGAAAMKGTGASDSGIPLLDQFNMAQSGMGPEVPAFKGSYAGSTGFAAHDRAAPAAQVEAGAAEEDGSDHGSIGADPADLQMQQVAWEEEGLEDLTYSPPSKSSPG